MYIYIVIDSQVLLARVRWKCDFSVAERLLVHKFYCLEIEVIDVVMDNG